tara:strand:- start:19 stop:216 length:198 start_codon:yes stop_codon:yes gene_type:complete
MNVNDRDVVVTMKFNLKELLIMNDSLATYLKEDNNWVSYDLTNLQSDIKDVIDKANNYVSEKEAE